MALGLTHGGLAHGSDPLFSARLLRRTWFSEDTFELALERPAGFGFLPGQGIRILWQEVEREYSLTCGPDDEVLTLCIRRIDSGRLTPALSTAPLGTVLSFSGPHGFFTFRSSSRQAVFVATGTGIAPFVSMARAGARGFIMLHGAPTSRDLHYRGVAAAAAQRYVSCLSREKHGTGDDGTFRPGRVTDFIRKEPLPGPYDFYLCGRRDMIGDAVQIIDERFDGSKVYSEIFH